MRLEARWTRPAGVWLVTILLVGGCFDFGKTVEVTSPDGGEKWPAGSTQTIRWRVAEHEIGLSGDEVKIEFSRDGGATWEVITSSADAAAGHSRSTSAGPPRRRPSL